MKGGFDRWVSGCIDGRKGSWVKGLKFWQILIMDGRLNWMAGLMTEWMHGWVNESFHSWMDGGLDVQTDRYKNESVS